MQPLTSGSLRFGTCKPTDLQKHINDIIAAKLHNNTLKVPAKPKLTQQERVHRHNHISVMLRKFQTITFIIVNSTWWWAAMPAHWLHKLPTVDVDKYKRLLKKKWSKPLQKTHLRPQFLSRFWKSWEEDSQSWCWLELKRHSKLRKNAKLQMHSQGSKPETHGRVTRTD